MRTTRARSGPETAGRLWRASFTVAGANPPDDLGTLEEGALSVSLFAIEEAEGAEPVAWRVELFLAQPPDADALRQGLLALSPGADPGQIGVEEVPAQDWIAASAAHQEPVVVGRFFVHPGKDRSRAPEGAVALEVEAGLAFGSGEHATTRACLLAIDRLARVRRCRRVLDLGCGSGILAMAAARCWPTARVVAADNDPVAVRVAAENAALNGLAGRVAAVEADGFRHGLIRRSAPFDLVLANILAGPLIELAPAAARHVRSGGHAVLSGLLDRHADAVEAAYAAAGFRRRARLGEGGPWLALVLQRAQARPAIRSRVPPALFGRTISPRAYHP